MYRRQCVPLDYRRAREELEERHGHYYLLSDVSVCFPGARVSQPFPFPEAWWKYKRGYSSHMGYARADLGLRALLARHEQGDRIAIVCHSIFADMIVTALMDFPRRKRHF